MPNLTALAPITTAATALSNLVLVSPQATIGYQPQNPPNADGTVSTAAAPPSFVFDYEGEQSVTLESDITDHYVEDNSAVQDQIALKPETITTRGFVGELTDIAPFFLEPVKFAANKLTAISAYQPALSVTALLAYTNAFFLYQVGANLVNSAVSAWATITGASGQTVIGDTGISAVGAVQNKQQVAFQKFYGYWRNRTLFTVQTPWAVFQNMALKSVRPIQDEDDRTKTSFELTFKMIRKTSSLTSSGSASNIPQSFQSYSASQAAGPTNLGTSAPVSSISLSTGLAGMGVA